MGSYTYVTELMLFCNMSAIIFCYELAFPTSFARLWSRSINLIVKANEKIKI